MAGEDSEGVLQEGHAPEVHQAEHRGKRAVNQGPIYDQVYVVEPVTQDGDAQRKRHDGQGEPPTRRTDESPPGKRTTGWKARLDTVRYGKHQYQQPPQQEPKKHPLGLLTLGQRGDVTVAMYLRVDGTSHEQAHIDAPVSEWQVQNGHHERDRQQDQPACPAGHEPPVRKEHEERYGWGREEQGLNHGYRQRGPSGVKFLRPLQRAGNNRPVRKEVRREK